MNPTPPREQPSLVSYLVAASLARVADQGGRVVLVLLAIDRTDSTAIGGVLVACFLVPHVVAAPVSGAIADRSSHRTRVLATALVSFGLCLALVAVLAGNVPTGLLMAIAVAGGCMGPLLTGGMTSLLGNLVSESSRDRAYGLDLATYNIAGIVGPAGGVMLSEFTSPAVATSVLGASALAGGLLVTRLRMNRSLMRASNPPVEGNLLSLDAIRHLIGNPTLRTTTLISSLGAAGGAALPIAAVLVGQESGRPGLTSGCVVAYAMGSLAGSLCYARRPFGTTHPMVTAIICLVGIALPFAAASLVTNWYGIVLLCGLAGFPSSPLGSSEFLVRDRESEESMRTQIFTMGAGIKMTCSAIGTSIAGFAAFAGSGAMFASIALVYAMAAGIGVLMIRRRGHILQVAPDRSP